MTVDPIIDVFGYSIRSTIGPRLKKPSLKVSSPGLEYADEYTKQVIEACPLRYTDPKVIKRWMEEQVPYEVTIGMAPLDLSDESTGRKKMGLGWLVLRSESNGQH